MGEIIRYLTTKKYKKHEAYAYFLGWNLVQDDQGACIALLMLITHDYYSK